MFTICIEEYNNAGKKIKKKGPKFKKKTEPEIPFYVPVVGPIGDPSEHHRIVIIGSITNMRHERQTPHFRVVSSEQNAGTKRHFV